MASENDKDILFENINYLLKERGIKVGDFEKDTGVYPGYISRVSKEATAKPGFDFIVKAASILHVSIDSLLCHRFSEATPTENYLAGFLRKLITDTDADKLSWNVEDSMLLSVVDTDQNGIPEHNLFTVRRVQTSENEDGRPYYEDEVLFVSKAFGYQTNINGNGYNIQLKNKSTFYLMDVKSIGKQNETPSAVLEAWIYIPREGKSFLCNTKKDDYLAELLRGLHSSIEESLKHPKIDSSVKSVIDAFMNNESEFDDDIPF